LPEHVSLPVDGEGAASDPCLRREAGLTGKEKEKEEEL
jgi:hypothetical protein